MAGQLSDAQGTLPGFEDMEALPVPRTYGARLTARRRALLASGVHPLNQRRLRPEGGTCGTCAHLVSRTYDKTYHKCELGPVTKGAATDVRLRWPACVLWEEAEAEHTLGETG